LIHLIHQHLTHQQGINTLFYSALIQMILDPPSDQDKCQHYL